MKPGGPFNLDDRRPLYLLGAALLLLGAAVGVEWNRRSAPELPSRATRPRVVVPGVYAPSERAGDAEPSSSLPRPRHRFADLLAALAPLAGRPLAEEFAERFLKHPELRRIWEEFQKTGDLQAFLEQLRRSPAFRELAREFAGKPGFPELAEAVANAPRIEDEVGGFIEETALAAAASAAGPAAAPPPALLSRPDGLGRAAGPADKVFHELVASVPPRNRAQLVQELEEGKTFPQACAASKLENCKSLVERCAADAACAKRLYPARPRGGTTGGRATTGAGGPTTGEEPTAGGGTEGATGGEGATAGATTGTTRGHTTRGSVTTGGVTGGDDGFPVATQQPCENPCSFVPNPMGGYCKCPEPKESICTECPSECPPGYQIVQMGCVCACRGIPLTPEQRQEGCVAMGSNCSYSAAQRRCVCGGGTTGSSTGAPPPPPPPQTTPTPSGG
ncbi:MAG: hypothetical protein HY553_21515 [Elusimicrobia bacterium]|nr:hypothetical protein [Elusimicrobiota bacterium]